MENINTGKLYEHIIKKIREYEQVVRNTKEDKQKEEISIKLRLYRADNNLTQDQLAEKLEVARTQIVRWESAKHKPQQWVIRLLKEQKITE